MKVERVVEAGVTYVNVHEVDRKRLTTFIQYHMHFKNYEGIAELYAFIFENFAKPEWYIVQFYGEEFIIQRLGK